MQETLAATPEPPYYAVVFSSTRGEGDEEAYARTAARMAELARQQPGFLGMETARGPDGLGITVSYWESEQAIRGWREEAEHREAQRLGRSRWYDGFELRICRVERAYGFRRSHR